MKELLLAVRKARKEEAEAMKNKKDIMASPLVSSVVDDHKAKKLVTKQAVQALADHVLKTEIAGFGVKIKNRTMRTYKISDAFEWCKKNMVAALTIDKKAFDAYLKTAKELPDFVEVEKTPYVTIPSDLSDIE